MGRRKTGRQADKAGGVIHVTIRTGGNIGIHPGRHGRRQLGCDKAI